MNHIAKFLEKCLGIKWMKLKNDNYGYGGIILMEAPSGGLSPDKFDEVIEGYVKEYYNYDPNSNGYKCKKCGSEIQQTTMYVSVHFKQFRGCAGGGECWQVPLPYCPTCEGKPLRTNTCVHV